MPSNRQLLIETYERLKDPAHWNGDGNFQRGKDCIVTALFNQCVEHSTYRDVSNRGARRHIIRAIRETAHVPKACINAREGIDIINWNDAKETTHADVVAVLRRAIKTASWPWQTVPA